MRAVKIALLLMVFSAVTTLTADLGYFTAAEVTMTETNISQYEEIQFVDEYTPEKEETFTIIGLLRMSFDIIFSMIKGAINVAPSLVELFGVPEEWAALINAGVLIVYALGAAQWLTGGGGGFARYD